MPVCSLRPSGRDHRPAVGAGDDQTLAGQGAIDGGIGEPAGLARRHQRIADMEMVAVGVRQRADADAALGIRGIGVIGRACQHLQDAERLELQGIELQGIGSFGHRPVILRSGLAGEARTKLAKAPLAAGFPRVAR